MIYQLLGIYKFMCV